VNFVFIITDTQNKSMIGAYGNPKVDTPNLDRLAEGGIRFERAYTTCPLCTPARGGIFTGLYPQINGAYCNNIAPHGHVANTGTVFRHYGYRACYTGKWHLDGSAYFGDGVPGGGFEPEWWYDGKRYAEEIGPEMFTAYRSSNDADALRQAGFDLEHIWGHRVADRAVDFMEQVGEEPFYLAVSFDEPHGPFVTPPEYWEKFDGSEIPRRPNFFAGAEGKPELLQIQRGQNLERFGGSAPSWEEFASSAMVRKWYGCNSYIDREIGRVVDAVDRLHGDDTMIIYTADHGGQAGSHGLISKGPMMYEESCNIPFIVRYPGGPSGAVCNSPAGHIDILPTLLDYAGVEAPEVLNGRSMRPVLEDPSAGYREAAMVNFHRFAINHDSYGEFYPVRCAVDGRYKLVLNLFETDELYDTAEDPYEMHNRIDDPALAGARDGLHDWLLDEMDRIRDPFRSWRWGSRAWRKVRKPFYSGGETRNRPEGFPFQPRSIDS
jgi:uncharacterized sulfatase